MFYTYLPLWIYVGVPTLFWLWFLLYSQYRAARYNKYNTFDHFWPEPDAEAAAVMMTFCWPFIIAIAIVVGVFMGLYHGTAFVIGAPIRFIGTKLRQKDLAKAEHDKWLNTPVEKILEQ